MDGATIKKVKTGEEKHTSDWGLVLSNSMPQETPEVQKYEKEVPGLHGVLDMSESIAGGVRFLNRILPFELGGAKRKTDWPSVYSKFLNAYHGQRVEITLDCDPNFYYTGRMYVTGSLERTARIGIMSCEIDAEPFKYEKQSSLDPWIWDTFSFVDGVIREYNNIVVNGTLDFRVIGNVHNVVPGIILLSGEVTVTFDGISHILVDGENLFYDYDIKEGDNIFTFSGNGTVAIDFKGVSL